MISALASLAKDLLVLGVTEGSRALVRVVRKKTAPEPEPTEPWTWQDAKRANDASHVPEEFKVRPKGTKP